METLLSLEKSPSNFILKYYQLKGHLKSIDVNEDIEETPHFIRVPFLEKEINVQVNISACTRQKTQLASRLMRRNPRNQKRSLFWDHSLDPQIQTGSC